MLPAAGGLSLHGNVVSERTVSLLLPPLDGVEVLLIKVACGVSVLAGLHVSPPFDDCSDDDEDDFDDLLLKRQRNDSRMPEASLKEVRAAATTTPEASGSLKL